MKYSTRAANYPTAWSSPIDENHLRALLSDFKDDRLGIEELVSHLRQMPYENLEFARVDHHRALRTGFPEVVFGLGKSPEQVAAIASSVLDKSDRLLVTRATPEAYERVRAVAPDATHHELARAIVVDRRSAPELAPGVVVVCAGTSDLPVAQEAAITARLMDCEVEEISDVGVAGLHRLLEHLPALQKARVVVAVAGMEGALPSVVGGLVRAPLIAVPTSIGYGASFGGLAALLAMLNSCASGVGVVNIDNGFGAGYLAAMINTLPAWPLL